MCFATWIEHIATSQLSLRIVTLWVVVKEAIQWRSV